MFEALLKVQAELMILGFISLLLTFGQSYFARICVSVKAADSMLPCPYNGASSSEGEHRRKLLWYERRFLAADGNSPKCKEGHEPLISINGLHQLHILIFFLAVFHVSYSAITMMLGRLKIRGWKEWEHETSSHGSEFSNGIMSHDAHKIHFLYIIQGFRLTHETSFVRAHTSFWTKIPFFFYVGCFLRQFFRSVNKADYMTLRNGFITVHLAPGSQFNFQKYIKRSLEDDFKVVVGVSPVLWASFVIFLLLNVNGWHALFWASLIPILIILALQTSNKYFWFGRPQLILHLIHFALFQNAFQITYFLWIWYSFGLKSCFHADFKLAIIKVSLGVGVLCLCSYITLPLYALVTQMGAGMKKSIFDEHTSKALKKWHLAVKKKHGGKGGKSPTRTLGSPTGSTTQSSGPTLHRYKTTGHSTRSSTFNDQDGSDFEADPPSPTLSKANLIISVDQDEQEIEMNEPQRGDETSNGDDFSFVKPAPSKNHEIA
ncbi:MLO-like protein [Quillaja saponaria]|uniref:MLO-like protein n=1 Tax=Quillaja saponaria TaxID=32244 RepID=A0AAD7L8M5_QUISA|nr:MLO-like protein [Quillaja saponaria]